MLCGTFGSLGFNLAKPVFGGDGLYRLALWPDVEFFVKRLLRESKKLWLTRVRRAGRQAAIKYVPDSTMDQIIRSTDDPWVCYVSMG